MMERKAMKNLLGHPPELIGESLVTTFSSLDLDLDLDLDSSSVGLLFSDDEDNLGDDDDDAETRYIEIALDHHEPFALTTLVPVPQQLGHIQQRHEGEGEAQAQAQTRAEEKSFTSTGQIDHDHHPDDQDRLDQFRVSIASSSIVSTFPGFSSSSPTLSSSSNTNNNTTSGGSSSNSNSTESSAAAAAAAVADGFAIRAQESPPISPPAGVSIKFPPIAQVSCSNKRKISQFPVFHRLSNAFLSPLKRSSSISSSLAITRESGRRPTDHDDNNHKMALNTTGGWEVVRSRKTSKPLKNGGGVVMKWLIKFQSIRSMVASLMMRPRQQQQQQQKQQQEEEEEGVISPAGGINMSSTRQQNKVSGYKKYRRRLRKPFDRWTSSVQPRNLQQEDHQSDHSHGSSNMMDKYSLDTMRRTLESLSVLNIGRRRKVTRQSSKSCRTSIKSSPMHGGGSGGGGGDTREARKIYTRDNSVHAAIAHCKSSLGQLCTAD